MLLRKIFENLHTVMAILVLFEQFSGKTAQMAEWYRASVP